MSKNITRIEIDIDTGAVNHESIRSMFPKSISPDKQTISSLSIIRMHINNSDISRLQYVDDGYINVHNHKNMFQLHKDIWTYMFGSFQYKEPTTIKINCDIKKNINNNLVYFEIIVDLISKEIKFITILVYPINDMKHLNINDINLKQKGFFVKHHQKLYYHNDNDEVLYSGFVTSHVNNIKDYEIIRNWFLVSHTDNSKLVDLYNYIMEEFYNAGNFSDAKCGIFNDVIQDIPKINKLTLWDWYFYISCGENLKFNIKKVHPSLKKEIPEKINENKIRFDISVSNGDYKINYTNNNIVLIIHNKTVCERIYMFQGILHTSKTIEIIDSDVKRFTGLDNVVINITKEQLSTIVSNDKMTLAINIHNNGEYSLGNILMD